MPFTLLYHLLPDVARAETRSLLLPGPDGVPRDGLVFMEMFCDEPGCDCRRVVFRVAPTHDPNHVLATIAGARRARVSLEKRLAATWPRCYDASLA